MLAVDRRNFSPTSPYADSPQYLEKGATISAPHMHAEMLEYLNPYIGPGSNVLDLGSGSGYILACLGEMVKPTGKVTGIEISEHLCATSVANIMKGNSDLINDEIVTVYQGNAYKGCPCRSPFDAIHVGASFNYLPTNVVGQLKPSGVMVYPLDTLSGNQFLYKLTKCTVNFQLVVQGQSTRVHTCAVERSQIW